MASLRPVDARYRLEAYATLNISANLIKASAWRMYFSSRRGLSDFGHFEKGDALKCPYTRF